MLTSGVFQTAMNAPAALGSVLTTKPGGKTDAPAYGMTMWFRVSVHMGSQGDLGTWSSCSGLGIKFNHEQLKQGGQIGAPALLPGSVSFDDITLERAMVKADSDKVRAWLQKVTTDWVGGEEGGAAQPGEVGANTMTITLCSSLKPSGPGTIATAPEVASWTLHDVVPVSWSAPQLTSKSGDIAIERLVLSHAGFLDPPSSRSAGGESAQGKLQLSYQGAPLVCQYNPEEVTLEKSVTIQSGKSGATLVHEKQVTEEGKLSITVKLRFEGVTAIADATSKLWSWLEGAESSWVAAKPTPKRQPAMIGTNRGAAPAAKPAPAAKGGAASKSPKVLLLQMGAGQPEAGRIDRDILLRRVNTTFTRFTATGMPCRALISLTMEEVERVAKPTNPSSGGPPGGRSHVVTEGDTLQGIATEAYGSPGAWREVAERNGIDDPLRLRNGSALYLPGR